MSEMNTHLESEELNTEDLDMLAEIGNIGAGNAVTSLSVLLDSKLIMHSPKVSFMNFDDFVGCIGGPENVIVAVMCHIVGDIDGFVLFAADLHDAHRLVNQLNHEDLAKEDDFTNMDLSAVKEIGNILIGSYLASMATLTGLDIRPTVPVMAIDMAGSVLGFPAIINSRDHDEILRIESEFDGEALSLIGHIMMIADSESYQVIRKKLGF